MGATSQIRWAPPLRSHPDPRLTHEVDPSSDADHHATKLAATQVRATYVLIKFESSHFATTPTQGLHLPSAETAPPPVTQRAVEAEAAFEAELQKEAEKVNAHGAAQAQAGVGGAEAAVVVDDRCVI